VDTPDRSTGLLIDQTQEVCALLRLKEAADETSRIDRAASGNGSRETGDQLRWTSRRC